MTDTSTVHRVRVADVMPSENNTTLVTWELFEAQIRSNVCLCCCQPGHYQEMVEAHIAGHGMDGLAVCVVDGRVHDGHHRFIAARTLGIEYVEIESKEAAGQRWLRDHGPVGWLGRRFGDLDVGEAAWIVVDVLMRSFALAQWGPR